MTIYIIKVAAKRLLIGRLPVSLKSRKRRHNLTLPEKKGHLTAKNFIIRLLYKDTY